jgi:hypothetical protein
MHLIAGHGKSGQRGGGEHDEAESYEQKPFELKHFYSSY